MWKTLYAIGLALPRIVFRPWREFQVVIPEAGNPVVLTEERMISLEEEVLAKKEEELWPLLDLLTGWKEAKEVMRKMGVTPDEFLDVLTLLKRLPKEPHQKADGGTAG